MTSLQAFWYDFKVVWPVFAFAAAFFALVFVVEDFRPTPQQSDRAEAYRCLEGGGFPVTNDIGVFRRCLKAEE